MTTMAPASENEVRELAHGVLRVLLAFEPGPRAGGYVWTVEVQTSAGEPLAMRRGASLSATLASAGLAVEQRRPEWHLAPAQSPRPER